MKVVKVSDVDKKYVDKNGVERISVNYYLVLDSGKWVAIRPSFAKGYTYLDAVCEGVKNG